MDDKNATAMPLQFPSGDEATPFDDGVLYDVVLEKLEYGLDLYLELALYRRVGFLNTDRDLLALRLADPTHVD